LDGFGKDEDRDLVHNLWGNLLDKKAPMTAEFRFKTPGKTAMAAKEIPGTGKRYLRKTRMGPEECLR
jgi:hypothetical protein